MSSYRIMLRVDKRDQDPVYNQLMPARDLSQLLAPAERNPGIPLDLEWVEEVRVNKSAVERRAATLPARRTVKKAWQAAWLIKAISCIDLTTLGGDDTPGNVERLCAKARRPIRLDLVDSLGIRELNLTTGAVCVYH